VLGAFGAGDLRHCLDSDGILLANLDTSYPGTRHVREAPFLGHRLAMPTGLLALAVRRAAEVRAMALVGAGERPAFLSGPPLPRDTVRAAQDFAAVFEGWVAARPEQWTAWASLEPAC
jgi:lauroyl/myristoyl acyltransferase